MRQEEKWQQRQTLIDSCEGILIKWLVMLQEMESCEPGDDEVPVGWAQRFGAKETSLSAMTKITTLLKHIQQLEAELLAQMPPKEEQTEIAEEDWSMLRRALRRRRAVKE